MAIGFAPGRLRRLAVSLALLLTVSLAVWTAASGTARADAIDGDWCNADRQHMNIKGASITTPGGNRIEGRYSRHFFSYQVPAGEPGAGETVDITLRGEYHAQSQQGPQGSLSDAPVKDWRRCQAGIS
jgi:hypothetical protein